MTSEKDILNSPDLAGYRKRVDLIQKVADQIEKDLNLDHQLKVNTQPDLVYSELIEQLKPIVQKLLERHYGVLSSVLYKIDVNEKKLQRALKENEGVGDSEVISHLIIERELIKVVYRTIYSKSLGQ